jgi:hypothetical protein
VLAEELEDEAEDDSASRVAHQTQGDEHARDPAAPSLAAAPQFD